MDREEEQPHGRLVRHEPEAAEVGHRRERLAEVAPHVEVPARGPEAGGLVEGHRVGQPDVLDGLDDPEELGGLAGEDLLGAVDAPGQDGGPDPAPAVVRVGGAPQEDPPRLDPAEPRVDHDRSRQRSVGQRQRQRVRGDRAVRVCQLVAGDLLRRHLRAGVGDAHVFVQTDVGGDVVDG